MANYLRFRVHLNVRNLAGILDRLQAGRKAGSVRTLNQLVETTLKEALTQLGGVPFPTDEAAVTFLEQELILPTDIRLHEGFKVQEKKPRARPGFRPLPSTTTLSDEATILADIPLEEEAEAGQGEGEKSS